MKKNSGKPNKRIYKNKNSPKPEVPTPKPTPKNPAALNISKYSFNQADADSILMPQLTMDDLPAKMRRLKKRHPDQIVEWFSHRNIWDHFLKGDAKMCLYNCQINDFVHTDRPYYRVVENGYVINRPMAKLAYDQGATMLRPNVSQFLQYLQEINL